MDPEKPRLPIQAQNQAYQYPEYTSLDKWAGVDQIEGLMEYMQE